MRIQSPLEIWDTLTTCYTGRDGLKYKDVAWLWEACETIASVNYAHWRLSWR